MAEVLEPAIDALGTSTRRSVVELNGGEEDNNAFLFKDGYDATVQEHVDDGTGSSSPTSSSPAGAPTAKARRSWSRS